MKRILIVGCQGQDGRLLREHLTAAGHAVTGIGRADGDILDRTWVAGLIERLQPDEVYYLAAHHHSSEDPLGAEPAVLLRRSFDVQVTGLVHFLEGIRLHAPSARLFYAASSHVFGRATGPMQNEGTPLQPVCAYGISKTAGIQCCRLYRANHRVFAACGILYNHESPYRRPAFVSQKIIRSVAAIRAGGTAKLVLGDLSARIDWGYAPDYVEAMTRILDLAEPDDFVVATGETHSVQEFAALAFHAAGLNWRDHVTENPALITKRGTPLCGDSTHLRNQTGWRPQVSFEDMISRLLAAQPTTPS